MTPAEISKAYEELGRWALDLAQGRYRIDGYMVRDRAISSGLLVVRTGNRIDIQYAPGAEPERKSDA